MARATLFCAVISAITASACSLGMGDLSRVEDPGAPESMGGSNGAAAADGEPMLQDSAGSATVESPLSSNPDASTGAASDAGSNNSPAPAPAPTCKTVTLTPTSAVSAGGGVAWRGAGQALVGDGNPSTALLSTDDRESAYLQIGGFVGEAIPANAVIQGLAVHVARSAGDCIIAQEVTGIFSGFSRSRSDVGDKWTGARAYGNDADTWGVVIPATAFDGSFAVRFKTRMAGTQQQCPNAREARVDAVLVTVRYCAN